MHLIAKLLSQAALVAASTATSLSVWAAVPTYSLTVTKAGTGTGMVSGSGLSCSGSTCSGKYNSGTSVVLTTAATGTSTFGGWSGCSTVSGGNCTVSMTGAKSVTAAFTVPTYSLTVTKAGTGTGTVSGSGLSCSGSTCSGSTCSGSYNSGTSVVLTAAATGTSTFGGWTGCTTVSGANCTVSMTGAKMASAAFNVIVNPSTRFLDFPILGYTAFTHGVISTVLDHDVPHDLTKPISFSTPNDFGPFGYNGTILSFTGELFRATSGSYKPGAYTCYPRSPANATATWSAVLTTIYHGTDYDKCTLNVALNYDNHPGYDYLINEGTAVYPAAQGWIIPTKCIRTFADNSSCEDYGAVAIDHGNGFITQYLHMKDAKYGEASNGKPQPVEAGKFLLGTVWKKGLKPTAGSHLHFEVLQRKIGPVLPNDYYNRSNYIVVDPYGFKPGAAYQDKLLANPGCLWKTGCQY